MKPAGIENSAEKKVDIQGVKPVGSLQFSRGKYYVYGVVEPESGDNFFREISHLDTECFQEFLNDFREHIRKIYISFSWITGHFILLPS